MTLKKAAKLGIIGILFQIVCGAYYVVNFLFGIGHGPVYYLTWCAFNLTGLVLLLIFFINLFIKLRLDET